MTVPSVKVVGTSQSEFSEVERVNTCGPIEELTWLLPTEYVQSVYLVGTRGYGKTYVLEQPVVTQEEASSHFLNFYPGTPTGRVLLRDLWLETEMWEGTSVAVWSGFVPEVDIKRDTLLEFSRQCMSKLENRGLKVLGTNIKYWQSVEDPTLTQYILELKLDTAKDLALQIWEDLTQGLWEFINSLPSSRANLLRDSLGLSVSWR
jgi:hypothetical protein